MSPIQLTTQAEYRRMPWKNGKGETLELIRHEDDLGVRCRISQASVAQSGTFSDFSGLTRHLVLLSGKGMRLTHQSEQGALTHDDLLHDLDIACFYGGDMTTAELLDGPIEDLNIMVREADTKAHVQALFAADNLPTITGRWAYFYANRLSNLVVGQAQENIIMPKDSLLTLAPDTAYYVRSGEGVFIDLVMAS